MPSTSFGWRSLMLIQVYCCGQPTAAALETTLNKVLHISVVFVTIVTINQDVINIHHPQPPSSVHFSGLWRDIPQGQEDHLVQYEVIGRRCHMKHLSGVSRLNAFLFCNPMILVLTFERHQAGTHRVHQRRTRVCQVIRHHPFPCHCFPPP